MSASLDWQMEIEFGGDHPSTGYEGWRKQRERALKRLADQMGLPLGREVEVWLLGGVRLRGTLRLREEMLIVPDIRNFNLELRVDRATFRAADIQSCVRLD